MLHRQTASFFPPSRAPLRLVDATPTNVKADLRRHLARMMRAEARSLVLDEETVPEVDVEELESDDLEEIEPISPLPAARAAISAAGWPVRPSTPRVVTLPVVRPPPKPLTLVPSLSFSGDPAPAPSPAPVVAPAPVLAVQPQPAPPAPPAPVLAALPPAPPPAPTAPPSLALQQIDLAAARFLARLAQDRAQAEGPAPDRQSALRLGLIFVIAFEMILLAGILVGRIPRGQLSSLPDVSEQHYDLSAPALKDALPAGNVDRASAGSSSDGSGK